MDGNSAGSPPKDGLDERRFAECVESIQATLRVHGPLKRKAKKKNAIT